MNYIKKIILLKQTNMGKERGVDVSGVCRLECEDELATISLSLLNAPFTSSSEYFCAILLENNCIEIFSLGKKAGSHIKTFSTKNAFKDIAVGIFLCDRDSKALISFGVEGNITEKETLKSFLLYDSESIKENLLKYDDEAVATENYYSLEEDIDKKVSIINGWDNERKDEDFIKHYESQEKEKGCASSSNTLQDEKCVKKGKCYSKEYPYYLDAKGELEELFLKFPSDESLSSTLPNGRFCKITYAEGKHYLVGTLTERGEVKYVCYGVPMEYSNEPPKRLKDYCSFIPLSFFDMQGKGVWMMFQDATTGECVKKEKA